MSPFLGVCRAAILVGPLAAALALTSCSAAPGSPTVRTALVSRADVIASVAASGSLSAVGTENLGFAVGGKLTSVRVKVGAQVQAGQVLATIDSTAAKASLAQAKGNLHAQQAGLDRLTSATTVAGAQSTADQANAIVEATKSQAAAALDADQAAIGRAKSQLRTDKDAKRQTEDALASIQAACRAAKTGATANAAISALAAHALQQIQAGDTSGAQQTLALLNAQLASSASAGDSGVCTQVLTAQAAVTGAKQKVEGDKTALVAAQQKKKVDAAAGTLAVASARQGATAAQNGLNSSSADRPHSIDQQQALVDTAQAQVTAAQKLVADTTLRAPSDGTVEVINGSAGEYVAPSTGTTAQAPGTSAAIPGAAAAPATTGASRPGGTQFMVLSNVRRLQLVLPLEQSDAAQVGPRQQVLIDVDALPGRQVRGTVVSVAPAGTATSGAISFYATIGLSETDSRLKDGQTARGTVTIVNKPNVLSVPNAAVQHTSEATTVTVVADNGSQQTAPFQAGAVGRDRTEVLSGLTAGQHVALPSGAS